MLGLGIGIMDCGIRGGGVPSSPYGPELNGDPGFDNNGYWTKDTGVTVSGSKANWAALAATYQLFHNLGTGVLVPGNIYLYTFTIDSISGTIKVANVVSATSRSAPGTYTETLVAGANGNIGLVSVGASTTAVCDNFSVKAVL